MGRGAEQRWKAKKREFGAVAAEFLFWKDFLWLFNNEYFPTSICINIEKEFLFLTEETLLANCPSASSGTLSFLHRTACRPPTSYRLAGLTSHRVPPLLSPFKINAPPSHPAPNTHCVTAGSSLRRYAADRFKGVFNRHRLSSAISPAKVEALTTNCYFLK
ncbi:hypothetical protein Nepgr_029749 [Nepenthes gracilis]|uniref:Uncharacterized protein n=1 Tax=Nepenthes gracilis TaxID=150966 RepID=A0AAD3TFL9_NEPGR|nr:hypothetical protein Nepgr_029749 [Nepenthes gracilis]